MAPLLGVSIWIDLVFALFSSNNLLPRSECLVRIIYLEYKRQTSLSSGSVVLTAYFGVIHNPYVPGRTCPGNWLTVTLAVPHYKNQLLW